MPFPFVGGNCNGTGLPSTTFVTRRATGSVLRTGALATDAIPYGTYPATGIRTGAYTVTVPGATVLLRVASSAFAPVAPVDGIVEVRVDGTLIGTLNLRFNEALEHHDLVPRIFNLTGTPFGAPGAHTVELRAGAGTVTDTADWSQAFVEQFPA